LCIKYDLQNEMQDQSVLIKRLHEALNEMSCSISDTSDT